MDDFNMLSNDKIAEVRKVKLLIAPRFLQIQKYPYQDNQPGAIITPVSAQKIAHYREFENIFRELTWWEGRDINELPAYVKRKNDFVYKAEEYTKEENSYWVKTLDEKGNVQFHNLFMYLPATEQEYLTRKNK